MHLVSRVAVAHRSLAEKLMSEIGLHAGQASLLLALNEKDGQSQAELVRELNVTPPTINKMIARLAEGGFVSNKANEDDRRILHVFLTPKGRAIRENIEQQIEKLDAQSLANFTDTERIMVSLLLKKMKENLD